jgi:hypothetical protein
VLNLPPDFFPRALEECRENFARAGGGLLGVLGLKSRPPYDSRDYIPDKLRPHYQLLLKKGQVVWGGTAMANNRLFEPGSDDQPGLSVYSIDPYYDALPKDLRAVGKACFLLKNTIPSDPDFQSIAARMTYEYDPTIRDLVTTRLTDGRQVYLGYTMFHRARLPERALFGGPFPLVVAPALTPINMVLPLPYWSKALRRHWRSLAEPFLSLPLYCTAVSVARLAKKEAVKPRQEQWDTHATPIRVTESLVKQYPLLARSQRLDRPHLYVSLVENGSGYLQKSVEYLDEFDLRAGFRFQSCGIPLIVPTEQLTHFRGAILDYHDTPYRTGIVVSLPDE